MDEVDVGGSSSMFGEGRLPLGPVDGTKRKTPTAVSCRRAEPLEWELLEKSQQECGTGIQPRPQQSGQTRRGGRRQTSSVEGEVRLTW